MSETLLGFFLGFGMAGFALALRALFLIKENRKEIIKCEYFLADIRSDLLQKQIQINNLSDFVKANKSDIEQSSRKFINFKMDVQKKAVEQKIGIAVKEALKGKVDNLIEYRFEEFKNNFLESIKRL